MKNVYDFNIRKAETKLVGALRKRRNESTVADLIGATGLPKHQVEQTIKMVSDEYQGHLRVTETGDILYYFPNGLVNRSRGFRVRIGRTFRSVVRAIGKGATAAFKVWTMVMLVGYFVLFVTILVLAVVASIAASMANRGGSRRSSSGGGFLSFFFVMRVFQIFAWIWLSSGTGDYRRRQRGWSRSQGRPLHRSVFAYVFGEEDPNKGWAESERQHILSLVRGRQGVLTLEELMAATGKSPAEAQQVLNRILVEWEGEPSVTENGTLVYLFPELLRSRQEELDRAGRHPLLNPERKRLIPFSSNSQKINRWITFFNGFNMLFSGYFLYFASVDPRPVYELVRGARHMKLDFAALYHFVNGLLGSIGMEFAAPAIAIALGVIPLAFSVLFYLAPLIRRNRERKRNESIKRENLLRKIYLHVFSSPDLVDPREITFTGSDESPSDGSRFVHSVIDELAALKAGEVENQGGRYVYRFPEIERELKDVREFRKTVDLTRYAPGKIVYDTGEPARRNPRL